MIFSGSLQSATIAKTSRYLWYFCSFAFQTHFLCSTASNTTKTLRLLLWRYSLSLNLDKEFIPWAENETPRTLGCLCFLMALGVSVCWWMNFMGNTSVGKHLICWIVFLCGKIVIDEAAELTSENFCVSEERLKADKWTSGVFSLWELRKA